MSNSWGNYITAPIESYHSEALKCFHNEAECLSNEVILNGVKFINGIEFNRLLADFKGKIMKTYKIKTNPIYCSSPIKSENDREIIEKSFYELMSKDAVGLEVSSPETYKKLKFKIEKLEAEKKMMRECLELICLDNIYVGQDGWKDEYFLVIKNAQECLNKLNEIKGEV